MNKSSQNDSSVGNNSISVNSDDIDLRKEMKNLLKRFSAENADSVVNSFEVFKTFIDEINNLDDDSYQDEYHIPSPQGRQFSFGYNMVKNEEPEKRSKGTKKYSNNKITHIDKSKVFTDFNQTSLESFLGTKNNPIDEVERNKHLIESINDMNNENLQNNIQSSFQNHQNNNSLLALLLSQALSGNPETINALKQSTGINNEAHLQQMLVQALLPQLLLSELNNSK